MILKLSSQFISETASRFLRHLGSIERLLEQDISEKPDPEKMQLGEWIDYVLHLKFKKLDLLKKDNNDEELKKVDEKLSELSTNPLFKLLDKKVHIEEEKDNYLYIINSVILSNAYKDYNDNQLNERYDISQYQNSLVVSLVIGLEILIADIFKDYIYSLDISNQVIKDKPLTFDDLKNFETVDDAKTFLLDQYIENLLRNSFDNWLDEIDSKMKINIKKMSELKVEINLINETLQRRHLIIHNDGIVNDLYIKKVDSKLTSHLVKGEELELDTSYISSRIDVIRKFGLILIYLYGQKKHKSDLNVFFESYNNLLLNILHKDCEGVRYVFRSFSELDIEYSSKLISKINYFLSYKLSGSNEADDEIHSFETNALSIEYQMAKKILLKDENVDKITIDFLKGEEDDVFVSISEWPLIQLVKENTKIKRYISRRMKRIIDKEMNSSED